MRTHTWIISFVLAASATTARAQPAEPPEPGEGSAAPAPPPAPAPTPQRQSVTVTRPTYAYVARNTNAAVAFIARAGDTVVVVQQQGPWTHVENAAGIDGWIATAAIAAPQEPYGDAAAPAEPPPPPAKKRPPDPRIDMPEVLLTPTGWLLPAAVLYSRTSLDTGGGLSSDNRVGLGDVAEFGVATTDTVRIRDNTTSEPSTLQPYVVASFRMGIAENRLFTYQPGLVLGFRKSFQNNNDGFKTRIAELTLVASKHLGDRAAVHFGLAFWDAEILGQHSDGSELNETLHGYNNAGKQLRGFTGFEARPFEKSEILIDLGWAPVFCKDCAAGSAITLRPKLSWGVRYRVADFMSLESGVRVPDIGDFNLLNAQIFGQVTFTSWALRHAVDDLK